MDDTGDEGIDRKLVYTGNESQISIILDMFNCGEFEAHHLDKSVFVSKGLACPISIHADPDSAYIVFRASRRLKPEIDMYQFLNYLSIMNEAQAAAFYADFRNGDFHSLVAKGQMLTLHSFRVEDVYSYATAFAKCFVAACEQDEDSDFLAEETTGVVLSFPPRA